MNSNGNVVFSAFRHLVRKRVPEESCDLCSAPLDSKACPPSRRRATQVMCACTPCAVLFTDSMTRFRGISSADVRHLPDCCLTHEDLGGVGYSDQSCFCVSFQRDRADDCLISKPWGRNRASLPADVWEEIVTHEPRLAKMQDDVQAFLVNRLAEPYQYYMAPIDKCFELVGTVRLYWKGFTGGTESGNRSRTCLLDSRQPPNADPRSGTPDLRFSVDVIKVASSAAIPTLFWFRLGIENSTPEERIHLHPFAVSGPNSGCAAQLHGGRERKSLRTLRPDRALG